MITVQDWAQARYLFTRVVCRDALALGRIGELTTDPSLRARPVCFVRRTDHHLTRAEE
ncbi:hypothetical protein [Mycobacterium sp. AT1]|uniref:hypothetical protein n=1 Tax=Mycobacterium sp. AT1 TaxID=1961706 RepID=UPI001301E8E7|nr:hypothetical protein [Mycobacterium sp. AT1]